MSSLMITLLYLEQFLSFWHGQDQPDGKQGLKTETFTSD